MKNYNASINYFNDCKNLIRSYEKKYNKKFFIDTKNSITFNNGKRYFTYYLTGNEFQLFVTNYNKFPFKNYRTSFQEFKFNLFKFLESNVK